MSPTSNALLLKLEKARLSMEISLSVVRSIHICSSYVRDHIAWLPSDRDRFAKTLQIDSTIDFHMIQPHDEAICYHQEEQEKQSNKFTADADCHINIIFEL